MNLFLTIQAFCFIHDMISYSQDLSDYIKQSIGLTSNAFSFPPML